MLPFGLLFAASAVSWFLVPRGPRRAWRSIFNEDADIIVYAARFVPLGGRPLLAEHVAVAALLDPRIAGLVSGREVEVAQRALRDAAVNRSSQDDPAFWSRLTAAAQRRAVTAGDLVRALQAEGGLCGELFKADEAALRPLDELRRVDLDARRAADESSQTVDVYAVNDERTTMAFVLGALVEDWQLDSARAAFAMHEAHSKGHGFVGRFPAADARQHLAKTQARGAALAFKLLAI